MRFVALVLLLFLSGCLESTVEEGRVFTVGTLDRPEDAGPMYSMKDNLSEGPVLVLFIGVGCIGCKDWTDDLREHHNDWMAQEHLCKSSLLSDTSISKPKKMLRKSSVSQTATTTRHGPLFCQPTMIPSNESKIKPI